MIRDHIIYCANVCMSASVCGSVYVSACVCVCVCVCVCERCGYKDTQNNILMTITVRCVSAHLEDHQTDSSNLSNEINPVTSHCNNQILKGSTVYAIISYQL